jgi:hypothetical protein
MKDWIRIAQAQGLDLPPKELERITQPLTALQTVFEPLTRSLTYDVEPATVLLDEEDQ